MTVAITCASMTSAALAGTYGPQSCGLNNGQSCTTSERHTYDDNGATAAAGRYISSWLVNPSTGTVINANYGVGSTYSYYRNNTDLYLDGYWANYSGVSPTTVTGTFNY